jgi:hypothetical protein
MTAVLCNKARFVRLPSVLFSLFKRESASSIYGPRIADLQSLESLAPHRQHCRRGCELVGNLAIRSEEGYFLGSRGECFERPLLRQCPLQSSITQKEGELSEKEKGSSSLQSDDRYYFSPLTSSNQLSFAKRRGRLAGREKIWLRPTTIEHLI